jgi:Flp pilus assembly protein TadD
MDQIDIVQSQPRTLEMIAALRAQFGLEIGQLRAMAHVAHLKMASADFAGAQRLYSVLAVMAPEEIGFQVGLADASIAECNFELAMTAASLIVSINPSEPRGYYLSGRASLGLGDHDRARQDLQTAIRIATETGDTKTRGLAERLLAGMRAN